MQPSKLPTLNRWFFDDPIEIPIKFPFTKEENQKSSEIDEKSIPTESNFHFTKEKIAKVKLKANEEANTNKISSLQALLTHLWRAVIHCQNIDPEEEILYCLVIDVRGRVVPRLAENYFGNALQVGGVKVKAKELLKPTTPLNMFNVERQRQYN
ncbi:HXXXD-type acyl-transferase family protein [Trifolium pratense]|uniref:HXXXD-type acyl-transferase family protein n=1 Tax=Trifolium pratense TaxID=57577 RepID=A0A2K3MIE1_TRIPR|nr:HXXXD-type acyl-transferase family protein [Trifolium pratense]